MELECKWYVVLTRSRAEKKISKGLSQIGVEHFLPLQKQLRQWKDRKKWIELPLFPSYIFIKTNEQYRNAVFDVPGVLKYLSLKGKVCTLSEGEIDRISRISRFEAEITITEGVLNAGDEVEVVAGPLKGIRGKLTEKINKTYLSIQIENLGFTASFTIDKEAVRRLEIE